MAEVNCYRGKRDLHTTLGDMLREEQKRVMDIEKEFFVVQKDLEDSKRRIERAGLYDTLQCQLH